MSDAIVLAAGKSTRHGKSNKLLSEINNKPLILHTVNEIINSNADVMILGCTHYPLLLKTIQKTVGKEMKIIDSATITARHILTELSKKKLLTNNPI